VRELAIGPYCWIEGLMKMILLSVCVMIEGERGSLGDKKKSIAHPSAEQESGS
jgi:hypothetical protein